MRNIRATTIVLAWASGTTLVAAGTAWGQCALPWTDQTPLNNNAATDLGQDTVPQVTTDGAGNWVAVWESTDRLGGTIGNDDDILVARSMDAGLTWTDPEPLNNNANTDSGDDWAPQVSTDGGGNWVAVWYSQETLGGTIGTDHDILVARSSDNGLTWTDPAPLNNNADVDSGDDASPQVTTDGAGNWVAVWYSNEDLDGAIGTDGDILVARSTNNGLNWTDPEWLHNNATGDWGWDGNPQVATNGAGRWLAVWLSYDSLDGTIGTDRDILIARSDDAGATWDGPAPLNNNAFTDYGDDWDPQLATDAAGAWVAVWRSNETLDSTTGNDWDILEAHSVSDGAGWSDPAPLNTNAYTDSGYDWAPQVATDAHGNWVVVWRSNDTLDGTIGIDRDILMARSVNYGVTWTDPTPVNNNAATDSGHDDNPQVTTDGAGNWVVVWGSDDDLDGTIAIDWDTLVARVEDLLPLADCNDNGISDDCDISEGTSEDCNSNGVLDECDLAGGPINLVFSDPAPLHSNAAPDSGYDQRPQLTTDGAGNWVAVWESNEPDLVPGLEDDFDILVARSVDDGANWTDPAPLNNNAATDLDNDRNPQVATDGSGNWVAVWDSKDTLGGTIGDDHDILAARSVDNGASWTYPAPLNNNAAGDSGHDYNAQVTTDGAGNWVAVWRSDDDLGLGLGTDDDIFVARSTDNGLTWTDPEPLNNNAATNSGTDWMVQVTTDAAGNWVAVWQSDDDLGGTIGTDWDILVARSVDSGATWTDPEPLCNDAATDPRWDLVPQVATDRAGHWVAVWAAAGGGDYDIFMARSPDKGVTWTDPAPLNNNAATDWGIDSDPQLIFDGAGNWVAVWNSDDDFGGTTGTDEDILVALSVDDGVTWTDPAPLNNNAATDSGDDEYAQLVTDAAGNWVAVWQSFDSLGGTVGDDCDILAARMETVPPLPDCNSNGVPDQCDLVAGTSADCNDNAVPDECDQVAGGDFDASGAVDVVDFAYFAKSMAGPNMPPTPADASCIDLYLEAFDDDADGDVDLADFAAFQPLR